VASFEVSSRPDIFKFTVFSYLPMHHKKLQVTTAQEGDIIDLTSEVRTAVRESGISEGMVHIFVTGSTAAVTTIEYEPGVLSDLLRALSVLAPDAIPYAHDSRWGDGNGRSHVKASLVGPSLSVPVSGKEPMLGTWQQIVLLELDIRQGRTRTVVVSVTGS
jgi:secondary thiamine-phosphate synthase enzyme